MFIKFVKAEGYLIPAGFAYHTALSSFISQTGERSNKGPDDPITIQDLLILKSAKVPGQYLLDSIRGDLFTRRTIFDVATRTPQEVGGTFLRQMSRIRDEDY